MSVALERVLERLRVRAQSDDQIADVLHFLAEDSDTEPFGQPDPAVLAVARTVNRRRLDDRRAELRGRALTTPEVVALIASMSDRKAVDRRRQRGTLLGIRSGNATLHPDWQFDRRTGETRPGLDRVLGALRDVTTDPWVADALATRARPELDGRSVVQLLADGHAALAVRVITLSGDQS